jgi:hypothetical protein
MMVRVSVGMMLVVVRPVMVVACVTVLMGMYSVLIAVTSQQKHRSERHDHDAGS